MRKLYLLRHAQAQSALEDDDKDRPLSAHGLAQARTVAVHLKDIDTALCSSARRTQMTLDAAQESGAEIKKIEISDNLYNAPAGDILNVLQQYGDGNVLIVAHNPGIHHFANIILSEGEKMEVEKLRLSYRPATLSVFECDVENWKDLQPQSSKLIHLIEID